MNVRVICASLLVIAMSCGLVQAAAITSVSIPSGSMDSACHPVNDGVYSVAAPPYPLDVNTGIGNIINPAGSGTFSLHDHVYLSSYVPDPSRAVVTYEFNVPAVVDQVEIIQHRNGITRIQGFVGDSLGSLTSIGSVFGLAGDVMGANLLVEGQSHVFDFNNAAAGRYFQMVILKTSLHNGWASYEIYPRDANGQAFAPIPEPASLALLACGGGLLLKRRRRR